MRIPAIAAYKIVKARACRKTATPGEDVSNKLGKILMDTGANVWRRSEIRVFRCMTPTAAATLTMNTMTASRRQTRLAVPLNILQASG